MATVRLYGIVGKPKQKVGPTTRSGITPVTVSRIANSKPNATTAKRASTTTNAPAIDTSNLGDSILAAMGLSNPSAVYDTTRNQQEQNPVQLVGQGSSGTDTNPSADNDTLRFGIVAVLVVLLLWILSKWQT